MHTKLTEQQRQTILERLAAGESPTALSRAYRVSRQYVSALKSQLRKPAPAQFDVNASRERLRQKAYPALESALDCKDDAYRRGRIAIDTLKGTGDLQGDALNVSVQAILASIPQEWRDEYRITPGATDNRTTDVIEGDFIQTPELKPEQN